MLDELGIQGSFFLSAKAVENHQVLDVNKIHFVLASVRDKTLIISDIYSFLDKYRKQYALETNEYYYKKLSTRKRFDTEEVTFIKRILQRELPERVRNKMVNSLMRKYVCYDEAVFSRDLYMNTDQLKCMRRNGMYIGSHGYSHCWLDTLSKKQQKKEVKLSLDLLKKVSCDIENFVFCYPYGAYNESLFAVLKETECSLALTTKVGVADLSKDHVFAFPRLDTNDLPKNRHAKPSKWYRYIRQ